MNEKVKNSITIQVEELSRPDGRLRTYPYLDILKNRIEADITGNHPEYGYHKVSPDFPHGIIAYDKADVNLVEYGYHAFFSSIYQAYADHRPYVLSPDMIWLLISQGFSQHVNNNSEKLRSHIVKFSGKLTIVNKNDQLDINNPDSPWELMFSGFTEKLKKEIGADLVNALEADFSTTTPVDKIASQITIMDSVKSYFRFIQFIAICGIPEITLEGSTADWKRIIEKVQVLRRYELDWWIDKLEPILREFVNASENNSNNEFWRNIFRIKKNGSCVETGEVDGWITNFFPYDADGKRIDGTIAMGVNTPEKLPKEISKTDIDFVMFRPDGSQEIMPVEVWAGFMGAAQDPETLALRPQTGWLVRRKDSTKSAVKDMIAKEIKMGDSFFAMEVIEIPEELFSFNKCRYLTLNFKEGIRIPERMGEIEFEFLHIHGEIDEAGIIRILDIFPNTLLAINRSHYEIMLLHGKPLTGTLRYQITQRREKRWAQRVDSEPY